MNCQLLLYDFFESFFLKICNHLTVLAHAEYPILDNVSIASHVAPDAATVNTAQPLS